MSYTAYITTAGQAAIAGAQFGGYKINLSRFKISNTLTTETNPAIIRNYTQLPGTVVYDSGNNPIDGSLTYTKLVSNAIVVTVYLHANIGDFTVGTIGLFLEDGTLFTILKLPQTYTKTKNTGNIAGNVISFPFTFTITIQDVLNLDINPQSVASLPVVATEVDLPLFNLAPFNNYYIQNYSATNLAAVACKTATNWQFIVATDNGIDGDWIKQNSASFDATATNGNVVFYNVSLNKWFKLDGDGVEQKLIGIRDGNGVRVGGFYYKLNGFQQGKDYYCDVNANVGKLTTIESKYYIGTALTNSLLKLDLKYIDDLYEGEEYTFYNAAVNAANEIVLTLDDSGKYPITYTNGLKISFVSPINSINNQTIRIGSLPSRNLTKRVYSGVINYSTNISANDMPAGSLVEATYISVDQGFRYQNIIATATPTTQGITYLQSNKNAIINGDFSVWQRGTSFASIAGDTYTADRWLYEKQNTSVIHTISRSDDVPTVAQAGRIFPYSLYVDCTTADTTVNATDYCVINQRIEGFNWLPLAQKTITLSFWVKATKTGTQCVAVENTGGDRSLVMEYTINTSNTWEYKTITIPPSPSSGTWNYTNGIGLRVIFPLMAGSNRQTTAGAWQTGDFQATANLVNNCDSVVNDFRLCGVQLEDSLVATPFEYRPIQQELNLCERYYERLSAGIVSAYNSNTSYAYWAFKTRKRAIPTFTSGAGSQFASTYDVNDVHIIVQISNNYTFIAANSFVVAEL